ncbi:MAG: hypothetical protein ABSA27_07905 [Terriglobales bacterium]|jgi:hypothetical protein
MSHQKTPSKETESGVLPLAPAVDSVLQPAAAIQRHRDWLRKPALQIPVLVCLFTGAALYEAFQVSAVSNSDIWWHLRTGVWMLQNHALPHNGLFSQYDSLPWIASSWGYDVLLAGLYKLLGLRSLPVMLMGFRVVLALLTFLLAGGWRGSFWAAMLVSAVAQYICLDLEPLPIFFSVLFFGVELVLLLESHRSSSARPLFWLPLLFLLWANLDVEFLVGLALLSLFLLAEVIFPASRTLGASQGNPWSTVSAATRAAAFATSALASLVTPYGIHLFGDAFRDAYGKATFQYLPNMYPMGFRRPRDFVLSLLVMAGFLALGRKRSWDLAKMSVMVATTLLAFRITRDGWCAVLVAVAIIGDELCAGASTAETLHTESATQNGVQRVSSAVVTSFLRRDKLLAAVLVAVIFVAAVISLSLPVRTNEVKSKLEKTFPVRACNFIQANNLPRPMFNPYEWGGFLIWYLPEYPVSIDGRIGLYGDDLFTHYLNVIGGGQRLESEPSFSNAGTILLEKNSEVATALMTIPSLSSHYRVVYSDEIAVVIVPNETR